MPGCGSFFRPCLRWQGFGTALSFLGQKTKIHWPTLLADKTSNIACAGPMLLTEGKIFQESSAKSGGFHPSVRLDGSDPLACPAGRREAPSASAGRTTLCSLQRSQTSQACPCQISLKRWLSSAVAKPWHLTVGRPRNFTRFLAAKCSPLAGRDPLAGKDRSQCGWPFPTAELENLERPSSPLSAATGSFPTKDEVSRTLGQHIQRAVHSNVFQRREPVA